ncbi:GntR family transcriptional regulator, partial [Acinetobacter baumannii]
WQNGDKISTIEELEAEFGVAKITISKAIEILREEKMLDSRQGLGTFVSYVPKERHWLNIANDLDGLIRSIKDNRVEIVHIEEKVA